MLLNNTRTANKSNGLPTNMEAAEVLAILKQLRANEGNMQQGNVFEDDIYGLQPSQPVEYPAVYASKDFEYNPPVVNVAQELNPPQWDVIDTIEAEILHIERKLDSIQKLKVAEKPLRKRLAILIKTYKSLVEVEDTEVEENVPLVIEDNSHLGDFAVGSNTEPEINPAFTTERIENLPEAAITLTPKKRAPKTKKENEQSRLDEFKLEEDE